MAAIAYHITWTTYGSWLPGDDRGWVRDYAPGIQAPDQQRKHDARQALAENPVILNQEQRGVVESTLREHCRIRRWTLHAVNVRSNHIHVVVTAKRAPDEVMNQLKAWCSRRLSDLAGLTEKVARKAGRRRWWTEHGSTKYIYNDNYLTQAIEYVEEGQEFGKVQ